MAKSLLELCASIVAAQAKSQAMMPEEIRTSLKIVYATLQQLQQIEEVTPDRTEQDLLAQMRHSPPTSMQQYQVVCLECGEAFQLLSNRHLSRHGLTPRTYKQKWNLPLSTALSAKALTQRRRRMARRLGMGRQLKEWQAQQPRRPRQVRRNVTNDISAQ